MMESAHPPNIQIEIPEGFIVFISGVPGVGKTTISYELLKRFNTFRIIEETDLIREVLRGYNSFLNQEFPKQSYDILSKVKITDHTKLLSLEEAIQQCNIMRSSFESIVDRQKRKGISSIINGVHIVPETLNGLAENRNVIYINLYFSIAKIIYCEQDGSNLHFSLILRGAIRWYILTEDRIIFFILNIEYTKTLIIAIRMAKNVSNSSFKNKHKQTIISIGNMIFNNRIGQFISGKSKTLL